MKIYVDNIIFALFYAPWLIKILGFSNLLDRSDWKKLLMIISKAPDLIYQGIDNTGIIKLGRIISRTMSVINY